MAGQTSEFMDQNKTTLNMSIPSNHIRNSEVEDLVRGQGETKQDMGRSIERRSDCCKAQTRKEETGVENFKISQSQCE